MTPNEIDLILERLTALEVRCLRSERLLYIVLTAVIGSAAIVLWQVVG